MNIGRAEYVEKLWGHEEIIVNNDVYCGKLLVLSNPCYISSLHYHEIKKETFHLLAGCVELELDGAKHRLWPGDTITIEPMQAHRFKTLAPCSTILEVSTPHDDSDVVRLEVSACLSDTEQLELPF